MLSLPVFAFPRTGFPDFNHILCDTWLKSWIRGHCLSTHSHLMIPAYAFS